MATVRPQRNGGEGRVVDVQILLGDWMRLVVVYYSLLILEFGGSQVLLGW
jgi:hypothetical protein